MGFAFCILIAVFIVSQARLYGSNSCCTIYLLYHYYCTRIMDCYIVRAANLTNGKTCLE